MADDKKESGPKGWLKSAKSAFKRHSRSSSSRSGGKTSGGSSPVTNTTASGSVMSLPSRSFKFDSNSLTPTGLRPTDAHSIHGAIVPGASPVIPEQFLRSGQQETTAPEGTRTNTQESLVSQRDEVAVHEGKSSLLVWSIMHSTNTSSRSKYIGSTNRGARIRFSI